MSNREYNDEQIAALQRHGYPLLPARGVSGEPGMVIKSSTHINGVRVPLDLRNRVCYLDGIEIDGHEGSDLDPGCGTCIHCGICEIAGNEYCCDSKE